MNLNTISYDEKSRDVNLGGWNIAAMLKARQQTFDD
jgi:hypothetical protein